MGKIIDAEKLIKKLSTGLDNPEEFPVISLGAIMRMIDTEPELSSAQRNGTWITDINDSDNAYCSECGLLTTKDLLKRIALVGENKPKFCPNCGAKMENKEW